MCPPPPLVFGAQKKPGLDRVKEKVGRPFYFKYIYNYLQRFASYLIKLFFTSTGNSSYA